MDQTEIARLLSLTTETIPKVSDEFGNWFAGIVDGEGSFLVDIRWQTSTPNAPVRKVGLRIQVRADDLPMLSYIRDNIGGTIGEEGRYIRWYMVRVAQCAEILVPIFDIYNLHSKKRVEYPLWRECVIKHYNLNKERKRNPEGTEEVNKRFYEVKEQLTNSRKYLGR